MAIYKFLKVLSFLIPMTWGVARAQVMGGPMQQQGMQQPMPPQLSQMMMGAGDPQIYPQALGQMPPNAGNIQPCQVGRNEVTNQFSFGQPGQTAPNMPGPHSYQQ